MGMPNMQVQQPMQQGGGKGMSSDMPGKQAGIGGMQQPRFGQANPYSNTVKPWDNANIMPSQGGSVGKGAGGGKGIGGQSGSYPTAATNFQYTLPQQQPEQQSAPAQQQTPTPFQGY